MTPKVGSVWKARDGRIVQVTEVIHTVSRYDSDWARLIVLNPQKRMRRVTSMALSNFGTFLQPHDWAAEHKPNIIPELTDTPLNRSRN